MTDDSRAPTIADTLGASPTSSGGPPRSPDCRYVLRSLLGRGGMGEVWLARDVRIERDIAIKMMRGDGRPDPEAVARFLREARVQGRLEHPAIVPVHDLGGDDDAPYFAMKRLTGRTLGDVIAARDPEWTRRTLLARLVDVCLAVELAHQRGVIHRDLKPANIMLGDFGETYVLDWGLARVVGADDDALIRTSDLRSGDSGEGQTVAGAMLGTPGYMAPEQMRGEPIDRRADVYALGCVLFEILMGTPAMPPRQALELTLTAACLRPSERFRDADVPPELDELCARATASSPADRIATARELADQIQRFLDGDRDLARRRELAAEHAGQARAALARGDEVARAEAMQQAGRALALDPSNADAQHVVGTLLLEPPARMPAAVQQRIDEDRQRAAQETFKLGIFITSAFIVLVPVINVVGGLPWWPVALFNSFLVTLLVTCVVVSRKPRPLSPALSAWTVGVFMGLLAAVGVIFGPLVLVPILIFGTLPVFIMMPTASFPVRAAILHVLVIAVPLGLEWLHVVPRTYYFDQGALVLRPWAINMPPGVLVGLTLSVIVLQLVGNVLIFVRQRRAQERAQELVHLQSWQLHQLVPRGSA